MMASHRPGDIWRTWAPWLVLLAYTAIVVFTTVHHEPWRDEAQAWLIARDLPLTGIISQMGYEGSPALWHLLLFPYAQFGAPYASEAVIHVILAVAGVGLLLVRGPFPLWFKSLLAFSVLLSYEYAVVARNYNLTLLLLFAVASLYGSRMKRPVLYGFLVALLANSNVHSVAMAAGLALLYAFEARRLVRRNGPVFCGLAIMALGLGASLAQLGLTGRNASVGIDWQPDVAAGLFATRDAWLPGFPDWTVPLAAAGMATVALSLWRLARPALWLLFCGLGGLYAIFAFIHSGSLRHHGLILVVTVFVLWLGWGKLSLPAASNWRRAILASLGVLLAAGLPFSVQTHVVDARSLFSGARDMATYINETRLANRVIVAHPSPHFSAVLPYLPDRQFWYADIQARGTFVTWNRRYMENRGIEVDEAARRAVGAPGWGPGALLLLNVPLPSAADFGLALRYKVVDGVLTETGEHMYLYERMP